VEATAIELFGILFDRNLLSLFFLPVARAGGKRNNVTPNY
jgi:hypothetical protein